MASEVGAPEVGAGGKLGSTVGCVLAVTWLVPLGAGAGWIGEGAPKLPVGVGWVGVPTVIPGEVAAEAGFCDGEGLEEEEQADPRVATSVHAKTADGRFTCVL